jgi:hypothetical protein
MAKKPQSKTAEPHFAEPPPTDEVKAKASAPIQFGPSVSEPGSRLKKR